MRSQETAAERTGGVRHVMVMGLDEFHLPRLRQIEAGADYRFHRLLGYDDVKLQDRYVVADLLDKARTQLAAFPGEVDGITGYWDFPVTSLVPILSQEAGVPGPSLEAVLACEHKYWSRLRQREVLDDVPEFAALDPFDDAALECLDVAFPVWVKPVKSFASQLAFFAGDREALRAAVEDIRAGIGRLAEPFQDVLARADLPAEAHAVGGFHCVVEQAVGGRQCTVEGYALGDSVHAYGIVDSIRYPNRSSFHRYEYPSRLPGAVRRRLIEASVRIVEHIGLRWSPFNIEFFYDRRLDRAWLLEINPRVSQSHSELFRTVDGVSNLQVMADVAVGRPPTFPAGRDGRANRAAKCFVRSFEPDGLVVRAPTAEEVAMIEERVPGTILEVEVDEGARLSDLQDQDAYSWVLAHVFVTGRDTADLLRRYEAVVEGLEPLLKIEPLPPA